MEITSSAGEPSKSSTSRTLVLVAIVNSDRGGADDLDHPRASRKVNRGARNPQVLAQMWILRADEGLVTREVTMTGGDWY
jgi:hypothetical protein